MYQFKCGFCDVIVQTESADSVKSRAKTHLAETHEGDVLAVLGDRYGDVPCHNDCGHVVAIDGANAAQVECPQCGCDNFTPLLRRYVYWRIEE